MKKILSLLLGVSLLLTLVGCKNTATSTSKIINPTEKITTNQTTKKQTTTVNKDIDPWYEDDYKEVDRIYVKSDDDYYIYEREIISTTTIKLSEDETIDVINVSSVWYDGVAPDGTLGYLSYENIYYNPVQKKIKIVQVSLQFSYVEFGTDKNGNIYPSYVIFSYYRDGEIYAELEDCNCHTTYIDLSAYNDIQFLKYLEN